MRHQSLVEVLSSSSVLAHVCKSVLEKLQKLYCRNSTERRAPAAIAGCVALGRLPAIMDDDEPPTPFIAFPAINEAQNQLSVLDYEGRALLALGTGRYVAVACSELCEVFQLLGPHDDDIGCADWSRDGAACLAVGSSRDVSFYHREPHAGAMRWAPGGRVNHEEPVHALRWAGAALWTASGHRLALFSRVDGGWIVSWSCSLSQPAKLLASSGDGVLLATAGEFDRLVKVWRRAQARPLPDPNAQPALSPHRLLSAHVLAGRELQLQLPPTSSRVAVSGVEAVYSGNGAPVAPRRPFHLPSSRRGMRMVSLPSHCPIVQAPGVSADCNVLLTLGRDGVARLWSPTQHPEPEPLRFHLCATLPLAGLTTGGQEAGSPRRPSDPRWMQWVQWLQACHDPSRLTALATSSNSKQLSIACSGRRCLADHVAGLRPKEWPVCRHRGGPFLRSRVGPPIAAEWSHGHRADPPPVPAGAPRLRPRHTGRWDPRGVADPGLVSITALRAQADGVGQLSSGASLDPLPPPSQTNGRRCRLKVSPRTVRTPPGTSVRATRRIISCFLPL